MNGEYGSSIALGAIPSSHPRILYRLERHIAEHPLPDGSKFNHYRPARYFSENVSKPGDKLSEDELNRFGQAFKDLTALL